VPTIGAASNVSANISQSFVALSVPSRTTPRSSEPESTCSHVPGANRSASARPPERDAEPLAGLAVRPARFGRHEPERGLHGCNCSVLVGQQEVGAGQRVKGCVPVML
jgi:hypothetical protein